MNIKKLFIILSVFLSATVSNAQWQKCPLDGGNVNALAVNGNYVYAGIMSGSGIFLSDDYCSNWHSINNGLPISESFNVRCISIINSEIYAGTNNGIYKSIDNGINWFDINNGLPTFNCCPSSIISKDTNIFIAMSDGPWGIYKSSDNGNTWISTNNGLTDSSISCLASDGVNLYAGSIQGGGIFKSINNGASWLSCNLGLPSGWKEISAIVVKNDTIYSSIWSMASNYEIYKSTDSGTTWSMCSSISSPVTNLIFCGNEIIAGTNSGVYHSPNGQNWTAISTGLTNGFINVLAVNGLDVFAGTSSGVFFLANNSTVWVPVNNGISAFSAVSLTGTANYLYAAEQSSGIYMTNDYGNTWQIKNNGISDPGNEILTSNDYFIYAGNHTGIYKSQNYGNSWDLLNTGMPNTSITSLISNNNIVIFGYYGGLFKSFDDGTTWINTNNGIPVYPNITSLAISYSNNLFAAIEDDGLYMSINNGVDWTNINNGFQGLPYISCTTVLDTIVVAGLGNYNPPVVYSYDNGQNWNVGANQLFGLYVNSLKTIENTIFASTTNGVYLTKNGNDWLNVSDGLPNGSSVKTVGNDNTYLYASVSGNGIWKRLLSDFNIIVTSEKVTNNEILIYPNPTAHTLYLNNPENVEVKILNLQGQTVSTKTISSNGNIDISGLSNGVYMVQINTKNGILYRKFVKQ